jgi:Tol biopolymer transport system component
MGRIPRLRARVDAGGTRVDPSRRAFTSDDVVPIADQVDLGTFGRSKAIGARAGAFFVSEDNLVYNAALSRLSRLVWLDRRGSEVGSVGWPAVFGDLSLAPDGRRALVTIAEGPARDVWMFDTERGTGSRVTSDPGSEFVAVFSPDGRRFAYDSDRKGALNVYERPVSGAGDERVILEDGDNKFLVDWSDAFMVYITVSGPGSAADLWTLPVAGDRTPQPFVRTPFREGYGAQASPDGRWIAYPSDKSSRMEVYISPYPPAPERERQISIAGGTSPRWE